MRTIVEQRITELLEKHITDFQYEDYFKYSFMEFDRIMWNNRYKKQKVTLIKFAKNFTNIYKYKMTDSSMVLVFEILIKMICDYDAYLEHNEQ